MKRKITNVLMFIGFMVMVLGVIIEGSSAAILSMLFSAPGIAATLAVCFVNSSNNTVKNVGFALSALVGACGVLLIAEEEMVVLAIGMLFMLFATLGFAFSHILKFFGWVKDKKESSEAIDVSSQLGKYKEMEKEQIISEEEFAQLKGQVLQAVSDNKHFTFDDLKKWKKLLDQQVMKIQKVL